MIELKVRKFGNSLGVILPKEVIERLGTGEGDQISLTEMPENGYQIRPSNADFRRKMGAVDDIIKRYRNTLRELAK